MNTALKEIFTRLRPIQDFVAVERIAAEKVSRGGIIIPDSAAEKQRAFEGTVIAIGPGRTHSDGVRRSVTELKIGDHVAFGRYAGGESALQDDDFWLIRAEEIDAIITP